MRPYPPQLAGAGVNEFPAEISWTPEVAPVALLLATRGGTGGAGRKVPGSGAEGASQLDQTLKVLSWLASLR